MSNQGEGSRGGKIIGHYSSGRAKYESDLRDEPQSGGLGGLSRAGVKHLGMTAAAGYAASKAAPIMEKTGKQFYKRSVTYSRLMSRYYRKSAKATSKAIEFANSKSSVSKNLAYGLEITASQLKGKSRSFEVLGALYGQGASKLKFGAAYGHGGKAVAITAVGAIATDAGYKIYNQMSGKIKGLKKK